MVRTQPRDRVPGSVWRIAVLGGMASWIDAGVLVASGVGFTFYLQVLGLNEWDLGVLAGLTTGGLAIGALIGGPLGDRFGRKRVFSVDLAILAVGLALLTFAPNATVLYVGVIITGLAMGADLPVSLALVAEETPARFRGKMVGFSSIMWGAGTTLVIVLSNVVTLTGMSPEIGARLIFGHLFVIAVVTWLLRLRLPESTEWVTATTAPVVLPSELPTEALVVDRRGLGALRGHWATVLALGVFYAMANISGNTSGQFNFFIITEIAGGPPQVATLMMLAFIPVGFISGFVFMRFADTKWRIPVFVFGGILMIVGMALPAVTSLALVPFIVGTLVSQFGTGLGGETLTKVWTQEKFPTAARASAQGVIIFMCRAVAAGVAVFTPALGAANPQLLYWLLTAFNALALLIGLFWVARIKNVPMLRDEGIVSAHQHDPASPATSPTAR